uniref:Uncharacterized protein n=1 Tax=Kalanchoe fedtschenkoi TaxID=63787 RepID=A0A7N0TKV8_KALFE
MTPDVKKVANVVGGKTARACDSCIRKRARWYCAADDAFLCQSCDSSVHSANPLARRHERVRLKTASFASVHGESGGHNKSSNRVPTWHSRKPRTPRGKKGGSFRSPKSDEVVRNPFYLVPEAMSDDTTSFDESDGQLLFGRVPVFDSFAAELCSPPHEADAMEAFTDTGPENVKASGGQRREDFDEMKGFVGNFCNDLGFLPSEKDLEEFAADVEKLLGTGLDDESFGIDGLGLVGCNVDVEGSFNCSVRGGGGGRVKDEEEEAEEIDMTREPFVLSFDYDEEGNGASEAAEGGAVGGGDVDVKVAKKMKILLKLDYEGIVSAWDGSSPWTTGTRPEVDPNDCWPTCMGACGIESHLQRLGDPATGVNGRMGMLGDGGREARVSRYREKRRTRLFSKKIRYEVRKLNAEKRPRMKGRFVKRCSSSFPAGSSNNVSLFT